MPRADSLATEKFGNLGKKLTGPVEEGNNGKSTGLPEPKLNKNKNGASELSAFEYDDIEETYLRERVNRT
jgi:hypothetical protein